MSMKLLDPLGHIHLCTHVVGGRARAGRKWLSVVCGEPVPMAAPTFRDSWDSKIGSVSLLSPQGEGVLGQRERLLGDTLSGVDIHLVRHTGDQCISSVAVWHFKNVFNICDVWRRPLSKVAMLCSVGREKIIPKILKKIVQGLFERTCFVLRFRNFQRLYSVKQRFDGNFDF